MSGLSGSLTPKRVVFLSNVTKRKAIETLSNLVAASGRIPDSKVLLRDLLDREKLMSTGIGLGIAVPHVRIEGINDLLTAVGVCRDGIKDYESLDGQPVRIVVLVIAGRAQHTQYIRLLAEVTKRLKDAAVREAILAGKESQDVYDILVAP